MLWNGRPGAQEQQREARRVRSLCGVSNTTQRTADDLKQTTQCASHAAVTAKHPRNTTRTRLWGCGSDSAPVQRTHRAHERVDEARPDAGPDGPDGQGEACRRALLVGHVGQGQVGLGHADGERAIALCGGEQVTGQ